MRVKTYVVAALFIVALAAAEDKPKYVLSETQTLRLRIAKDEALLAQQNYSNALNAYTAEIAKVKAENKWSDAVQYNADTITFSDPPVAAPVAPEAAKR